MTESNTAGNNAPRPSSGGGGDSQNEAANNADEITCQSNSKDVEKGPPRRSRRKHRPLLRRILHYIQTTWIGGKFNPKAGKYPMHLDVRNYAH